MVHLPSSTPMDLQMARAKGSFAVPLKIFTEIYSSVKIKNHHFGGRKVVGI
jgi:hypothetical protein